MIHTITVQSRRIRKVDPKRFVQHGISADELVLNLDAEWSEVDRILITLQNEAMAGPDAIAFLEWDNVTKTPVTIPKIVLSEVGPLDISIIGYGDDIIRVVTEALTDAAMPQVVLSGLVPDDAQLPSDDPDGVTTLPDLLDAVDDACKKADLAMETVANIDEIARGTQVSVGSGPPKLGGKEGDSYIDSDTGTIYVFGSSSTN